MYCRLDWKYRALGKGSGGKNHDWLTDFRNLPSSDATVCGKQIYEGIKNFVKIDFGSEDCRNVSKKLGKANEVSEGSP